MSCVVEGIGLALNPASRDRTPASAGARHAPARHAFAWLRLVCALLVVFEHAAPLSGSAPSMFPLGWNLTPGHLGLMAFFAMSGYQIAESWHKDPSYFRFVVKRLLRIWPPLLTVVLITAVVIGPIVTTLSSADYFGDQSTWGYILNNATVFNLQHGLPGVFVDNPYPGSVNGSIWTLPMELVGYGLVLILGITMSDKRYRFVAFVVLLALVAIDRRLQIINGGSFLSVPVGPMMAFLVPFMMGVVLFVYRDTVPLLPKVALLLLLVQLAVQTTTVGPFWLGMLISYGAVTLAHHWPARLEVAGVWLNGSYGTYLWGFPLAQILVHLGVREAWSLAALSMLLAYGMGIASLTLIEGPTMRLRGLLLPEPVRKPSGTSDTVIIPRVAITSTELWGPASAGR